MVENKKVEDIYKKLTHKEQILLRPDTYIGSVEATEANMWVVENPLDLSEIKIRKRNITYIPAFIKLFDEILTNASDHKQRGGGVKEIRVSVTDDFQITVWNDGTGIPIEMHKEENCYVPELIFGHLLSGSNYDDTEERFGGGRNGYGAKLTNIFSSMFQLCTADGKKSYKQIFTNNMNDKTEPVIAKSNQSYTEISYNPDFSRLPIVNMEDDTRRLIIKRVLDIAAYNPDIKVYYNNTLLPIKSLKDYAKMHLEDGAEIFYETLNDRFDIAVAQSGDDSFEQVSIVNGISTYIGGSHVDYISNMLCTTLRDEIVKGKKKIKLRPQDVKNKIFLFLVAKVPNPSFDSQTKENLKTKMIAAVTKSAAPSEKFIKQVIKSDIVKSILDYIYMREQLELQKMSQTKGSSVKIPKLKDAYKAGSKDAEKCYLFLAEGDSAVATCISGISVVGNDYFGTFPLKGKPLNVRQKAVSKITENDELKHILSAVGLKIGTKYTDTKDLRYGKIVLMTDADVDGTHIKGLLINFLNVYFPELLKMDFLYEFITPIVKARKGKETLAFYSMDKYKNWRNSDASNGWKIKYYKGLGTIQAEEIKGMFKTIDKHLIPFNWKDDANDVIDLAFNDKRAGDRKEWLTGYRGEIVPEKYGKYTPYNDFFNQEFIQYSMADNIRSLPQMMDGLKPSQRKVLHGSLKLNLKNMDVEEKVAFLSGKIAAMTAYHHGSVSLESTIVSMAQDFVGANNVNLLMPSGMFGTRLKGGDDASSARYIFTYLNPLTRYIFRAEDDDILNYLNDDGYPIEPDYFLPIVPMCLVNGADGVGTGWSTNIPMYNIKALIKIISKKLEGEEPDYRLRPNYRGFKGKMDFENDKWISKGVYEIIKAQTAIHITELPINTWTDKYLEHLDVLQDAKFIKSYRNASSDDKVDITISISKENAKTKNMLEKLKLTSALNTTNMHMFVDNKIVKFDSPESILENFYEQRLYHYGRRKEYMMEKMKQEYQKIANIYQFILYIVEGQIEVYKRPIADIHAELEEKGFRKINESYNYLTDISLSFLTKEKVDEYGRLKTNKAEAYKALKVKRPEDLWLDDLTELTEQIIKLKL